MLYTVCRTDCSLCSACAPSGILKMLVYRIVCEDVKNTYTHRDNVSSPSGRLLQLLLTMRDNIWWNGAMKEQKWIFCFDFCLKKLLRWWACMHSLICSCFSLLAKESTCLHLHEAHHLFFFLFFFFHWDQWLRMNNLVSYSTSPPGSCWRSTSQKLPIISSWLH